MGYNIMAMKCNICPRNCNVERGEKLGACGTRGIVLSRVARHDWEEPCISGAKGSGTVFFAGCNLHCRFCQNYDISILPHGEEVTAERLADVLLYVQDTGVANVNLVTAAHCSNQVARALTLAKPRLTIPVVYNTSSYEKAESLRVLDGLVDVYLPDLKFCDSGVSALLANAPDYFQVACAAIAEMRRQQPHDLFDGEGYLVRGVIVRHLVLPSYVEDTKRVLDWLSDFDKDVYVSLMSQYFVARHDGKVPSLNRRLYKHEYKAACEYFANVGLHNGFFQELDSATRGYLPDFDDKALHALLQSVPHIFDKQ